MPGSNDCKRGVEERVLFGTHEKYGMDKPLAGHSGFPSAPRFFNSALHILAKGKLQSLCTASLGYNFGDLLL